MSYTAPPTRSGANTVASSDWNTYVRDDIAYLFSQRPKSSMALRDNNGTYTTTGTSFAAVDSTNLKRTLTINSGMAMFWFNAIMLGDGTAGGYRVFFDVAIDGVLQGLGDGLTAMLVNAANNVLVGPLYYMHVKAGLTAGSHTFELHWKVNTGTGKLSAGSGTPAQDAPVTFDVMEVG